MEAIDVRVWRGPSDIEDVVVRPDFRAIVRSERLLQVVHDCLQHGAVVAAAVSAHSLCGYATVVPSALLVGERWQGVPWLHELGAIEVARSSRRRGIGGSLLASLEAALPQRRMILMSRGLIGHWDYHEARLSPPAYRKMLLDLLFRIGLVQVETDDPEVEDNPLNFLAARVGIELTSDESAQFHRLLQLSPQDAFSADRSRWGV